MMSSFWQTAFWVLLAAIAVLASALAGLASYLLWRRRKYSHIPSPPMANFFLGHLQPLVKAKDVSGTADHVFLKWASEIGDLFVTHAMWMSFVIVLNKDDVKKSSQARKVTGSLFGERFLGNGLVVIEDYETWRPRRKLYDPAFNKSYLKDLCPKFNSCVELFLDKLAPHAHGTTEVAFASDFDSEWNHMPLLLKHSRATGVGSLLDHTFIGMQKAMDNPLYQVEWKGTSILPYMMPSLPLQYLHPFETRSYRETIRAMRSIGRECIRKRIRAFDNGEDLPDDILTSILKVASNDAAADIETLVDDFVTFYIAGQETTANTLSFAVVLTCLHPEVQERLVSEVDEVLGGKTSVSAEDLERLQYTEQVIEETLRMYPPLAGTVKEAPSEGVTLSQYYMPAGTPLFTITSVACRMPENFDDPDTFNPSRFDPENPKPSPFVYFPFGVGHRSCIGKHFAMIEAKIILARLFQTFKVSLPLGYKVEVMEKGTRQPKGDVPCTLQCRSK
ncbi:hypothetical protein EMCRGX_G013418 [Ephydatia muelleri]